MNSLQQPDKGCVLVIRETHPADDPLGRVGGKRNLTFIIGRENQTDVGALAARFIAPGGRALGRRIRCLRSAARALPMRRVNHQHAYRAADGTTDNQAESYFSRFRRMQIGQHHKFGLSHPAC